MALNKESSPVLKATVWLFTLFAIAVFAEYPVFAHDDWHLNDGQTEMSDAEEIEMDYRIFWKGIWTPFYSRKCLAYRASALLR